MYIEKSEGDNHNGEGMSTGEGFSLFSPLD